MPSRSRRPRVPGRRTRSASRRPRRSACRDSPLSRASSGSSRAHGRSSVGALGVQVKIRSRLGVSPAPVASYGPSIARCRCADRTCSPANRRSRSCCARTRVHVEARRVVGREERDADTMRARPHGYLDVDRLELAAEAAEARRVQSERLVPVDQLDALAVDERPRASRRGSRRTGGSCPCCRGSRNRP